MSVEPQTSEGMCRWSLVSYTVMYCNIWDINIFHIQLTRFEIILFVVVWKCFQPFYLKILLATDIINPVIDSHLRIANIPFIRYCWWAKKNRSMKESKMLAESVIKTICITTTYWRANVRYSLLLWQCNERTYFNRFTICLQYGWSQFLHSARCKRNKSTTINMHVFLFDVWPTWWPWFVLLPAHCFSIAEWRQTIFMLCRCYVDPLTVIVVLANCSNEWWCTWTTSHANAATFNGKQLYCIGCHTDHVRIYQRRAAYCMCFQFPTIPLCIRIRLKAKFYISSRAICVSKCTFLDDCGLFLRMTRVSVVAASLLWLNR